MHLCAAPGRRANYLQLIIPQDDGRIGLQPASLPPYPVFIRGVQPGSLAERKGVGAGDELLEVGGVAIASMAKEDLYAAMQQPRPFAMVFSRRSAGKEEELRKAEEATQKLRTTDSTQKQADRQRKLDQKREQNMKKREEREVELEELHKQYARLAEEEDEYEQSVAEGGVANTAMLIQLRNMHKKRAILKVAEKQQEQEIEQSQKQAKLMRAEADQLNSEAAETRRAQIYRITVGHNDGKLGLQPASLPPQPCIIRAVEPGTMAERKGVKAGDELLEVGGTKISAMTADQLYVAMRQSRPFDLVLSRGSRLHS